MPEGCEGGGEAQGGGYGGSASCGSAPRCRTLFQARLRECKFCMQRGGWLHVPIALAVSEKIRRFRRDSPVSEKIRANCTTDSHSEVSGSKGDTDGRTMDVG